MHKKSTYVGLLKFDTPKNGLYVAIYIMSVPITHDHNERNVSILSTRLYRLIPKQEIQRDMLIFHPACEDLVKGLPPSRNAVDGMHCGGLLSGW